MIMVQPQKTQAGHGPAGLCPHPKLARPEPSFPIHSWWDQVLSGCFPTYRQLLVEESEDHWVGEVGHHSVHQGDADYLVTQDVAAVFILLKKKR